MHARFWNKWTESKKSTKKKTTYNNSYFTSRFQIGANNNRIRKNTVCLHSNFNKFFLLYCVAIEF